MSWDLDAMSVLPEDWQEDIVDNFTPEYLAEKLSDYIIVLENEISILESHIELCSNYFNAQ